MSLFNDVKVDTSAKESGDVLGGYSPLPMAFYNGTVKVAYVGKAAASNARNVTVILDLDGKEYSEIVYFTTKNGETFSTNDKGEKRELPGYSLLNELCLLTTNRGLVDQPHEEKIVEVYDYEQKKKLPKAVPVLTEMTGKAVGVGLFQKIVDKTKRNESTNVYEPTGETRNINALNKFFYSEDGRTVTEIRNNIEEAKFKKEWMEKYHGKDPINEAKGVAGKSGSPGRPAPSGNPTNAGQAAGNSLFGNK